jgi:hypothetical protein
MVSSRRAALVPVEHITQSILVLRGQKVLLDAECVFRTIVTADSG